MQLEVGKKYHTMSPVNVKGWVEVLKEHGSDVAVMTHTCSLLWIKKHSTGFNGCKEVGPFAITGEFKLPVKYSVEFYSRSEVKADPSAEVLLSHFVFGLDHEWQAFPCREANKYRVTVESVDE